MFAEAIGAAVLLMALYVITMSQPGGPKGA